MAGGCPDACDFKLFATALDSCMGCVIMLYQVLDKTRDPKLGRGTTKPRLETKILGANV